MLDELPRYDRAQGNAEQYQQRLCDMRRQGEGTPRQCRSADRDHRTGNQAAWQVRPQEDQAACTADGKCFDRTEEFGAVGNKQAKGCGEGSGDLLHAALWQIRLAATIALTQVQQCRGLALPEGAGTARAIISGGQMDL
jgi:hypothetical protein